jgi:photosystem II stability/assembly factor-like uncharacterized protein
MTKKSFNLKNVAITIACFAVSSLLLVSGCKKDDKKDDNPTLTGIEFDKPAISIAVNGTYDLKVVPVPSKAELPTCTFVSDNDGIAKVNSAGTVTGVAKGKVTITASAGGFTAKCTVTVTDGTEPPLTGIIIDPAVVSLAVGGTQDLKVVAVPEGAVLSGYTFASDNKNVATVSNAGKVAAVAAGTANITATTDDGKHTAVCVVTVSGSSGDGLDNWTKVTNPLDAMIHCIAFGNGKFVAGSEKSMIIISSDNGKTWTTKKIVNSSHGINSIIYVNGMFVAAGSGGKVFYANNPEENWTMVDLGETLGIGSIEVIYFDGTHYITGGASGTMAYSTDLVNWTANTTSLFFTEGERIFGYAYGKGKLVGVGYRGTIAYATSPGGEWTSIPNNPVGKEFLSDIIYVNNTFIAVGSTPTIVYADDAASTWTLAPCSTITALETIVYGAGYYVTGGSLSTILYANSLDKWTKATNCQFTGYSTVYGIAFGNNTFVAVGDDGASGEGGTISYITVK